MDKRKQALVNKAIENLDKYKLDYTEHNNGIHLKVIAPNDDVYNYYPTTESWTKGSDSRKGFNNMLRDMQLI